MLDFLANLKSDHCTQLKKNFRMAVVLREILKNVAQRKEIDSIIKINPLSGYHFNGRCRYINQKPY